MASDMHSINIQNIGCAPHWSSSWQTLVTDMYRRQSVPAALLTKSSYIWRNKWRIFLLWSAVAICISTRTLLVVFTICSLAANILLWDLDSSKLKGLQHLLSEACNRSFLDLPRFFHIGLFYFCNPSISSRIYKSVFILIFFSMYTSLKR
jgi:hypothetical protein